MRYAALFVALALGAASRPSLAQTCSAEQGSLTWNGGQPSTNSHSAAMSADGRVVAWGSASTNVLPPGTTSNLDVYVTELDTGLVELVSVDSTGAASNGDSRALALSSNGGIVVFTSDATNLIAGSQSVHQGIYVHDRSSGQTSAVNVTPGGVEGFGGAYRGVTRGSGRYVAFDSYAGDLVAGDSNGFADVFLRDRASGTTELISVTSTGAPTSAHSFVADLSPDARFVLFTTTDALVPGDTNARPDAYLFDRSTRTITRVSKGTNNNSSGAALSADGRFAAFVSRATNLYPGTGGFDQVYVRDLLLGTTTIVSIDPLGRAGDDFSRLASLSADGRYAVFGSDATNLISGDTNGQGDVFVRDLVAGTTALVSATASGAVPLAKSWAVPHGAISADGRSVCFLSKAPNITSPPDPNGKTDAYVRTCLLDEPTTYCVAEANSLGCVPAMGSAGLPSASAGSGFVLSSGNTLSNRAGLFFYGLNGAQLVPFQGGFGCVEPPVRRTPLQNSGGALALDCSGQFALDFNARIVSGIDPALVAGQSVWGQWWSRDSGSAYDTNLGDAIHFTIGH